MKKLMLVLTQMWTQWISQFERSEMILVQETDAYKIYARKETEQDQRFSTYIFENACYPDRTEPWASILPGNQRVYFEIKNKKNDNRLGFSDLVKKESDFKSMVTNYLNTNMPRLEQKKWWNKFAVGA